MSLRRRQGRRRARAAAVPSEAVVLGVIADVDPVGIRFDFRRHRRRRRLSRCSGLGYVGVGAEVEGAGQPLDPLRVISEGNVSTRDRQTGKRQCVGNRIWCAT